MMAPMTLDTIKAVIKGLTAKFEKPNTHANGMHMILPIMPVPMTSPTAAIKICLR